jgi:hypothetical protein
VVSKNITETTAADIETLLAGQSAAYLKTGVIAMNTLTI